MSALLAAEGLARAYPVQGGLFSPRRMIRAVRDVSLTLARGEALALVGESGCGKSTVGRLLLRLEEADAGRILFDGQDLRAVGTATLRALRRRMQPVFQDPYASLDPRRRIRDVLEAPIRLHRLREGAAVGARAAELMAQVGLAPDGLDKLPHQFSGGQRQRIAIARALAVEPDLIICDEPVSALDVSVQAQVVNLLAALRRDAGVALLFISHDLAVVRHLADRVVVMYAGRIVEEGATEQVFTAPRHPYTAGLIAAAPRTDRGRRVHAPMVGEPPDPLSEPSGCAFAPRCTLATARCNAEAPLLRDVAAVQRSACHHAENVPMPDVPGSAADTPLARRLAIYRRARAAGAIEQEVPHA
ncbi:ABC transporter ATP-binding protein [Elioraea sp.]|uniref:ABC transporter ATP-binding protein n=1 Tax=Elioraea sp. TaxID=2185103 RepID=UPI0025B81D6B|nr:oligopeptide/dipeptide ABC transporter ATP-binding protein [Elioraea sp.]